MKLAVFARLAEMKPLVGQEIAVSDWVTITQARINQFADATGDHQWIHVDVERAAGSPFKSTIAHGFLTLALISNFAESAIQVKSMRLGVNYGCNKVRFIHPVKADSRVRGRFVLAAYDEIEGGAQILMSVTVEIEGQEKPACMADCITRLYE